jgi:hypothetical protein
MENQRPPRTHYLPDSQVIREPYDLRKPVSHAVLEDPLARPNDMYRLCVRLLPVTLDANQIVRPLSVLFPAPSQYDHSAQQARIVAQYSKQPFHNMNHYQKLRPQELEAIGP